MTKAIVVPFIRILLIVLSVIRWTVLVWVILSWILFFASQTSFRWRNRGAYNVLTQLLLLMIFLIQWLVEGIAGRLGLY